MARRKVMDELMGLYKEHSDRIQHASGDFYRKGQLEAKWRLLEKTGEGSFATVKRAELKKRPGVFAAVKIIRKVQRDDAERQKDIDKMILREVYTYRIMATQRHRNVVRLFEVFEDAENVFLVLELLDGEPLSAFPKHGLSEVDIAKLAKAMIDALAFCHRVGVAHRDITPMNWMFANKRDAHPDAPLKLTDFGLAFYTIEVDTILRTPCGTPQYMAPEIIRCQPYDERVDIWSFGIIVYELFLGETPFHAEDETATLRKIKYVDINWEDERWNKYSPEARSFVQAILIKEPETRPRATQVRCHAWMVKHVGQPRSNLYFQRVKTSHGADSKYSELRQDTVRDDVEISSGGRVLQHKVSNDGLFKPGDYNFDLSDPSVDIPPRHSDGSTSAANLPAHLLIRINTDSSRQRVMSPRGNDPAAANWQGAIIANLLDSESQVGVESPDAATGLGLARAGSSTSSKKSKKKEQPIGGLLASLASVGKKRMSDSSSPFGKAHASPSSASPVPRAGAVSTPAETQVSVDDRSLDLSGLNAGVAVRPLQTQQDLKRESQRQAENTTQHGSAAEGPSSKTNPSSGVSRSSDGVGAATTGITSVATGPSAEAPQYENVIEVSDEDIVPLERNRSVHEQRQAPAATAQTLRRSAKGSAVQSRLPSTGSDRSFVTAASNARFTSVDSVLKYADADEEEDVPHDETPLMVPKRAVGVPDLQPQGSAAKNPGMVLGAAQAIGWGNSRMPKPQTPVLPPSSSEQAPGEQKADVAPSKMDAAWASAVRSPPRMSSPEKQREKMELGAVGADDAEGSGNFEAQDSKSEDSVFEGGRDEIQSLLRGGSVALSEIKEPSIKSGVLSPRSEDVSKISVVARARRWDSTSVSEDLDAKDGKVGLDEDDLMRKVPDRLTAGSDAPIEKDGIESVSRAASNDSALTEGTMGARDASGKTTVSSATAAHTSSGRNTRGRTLSRQIENSSAKMSSFSEKISGRFRASSNGSRTPRHDGIRDDDDALNSLKGLGPTAERDPSDCGIGATAPSKDGRQTGMLNLRGSKRTSKESGPGKPAQMISGIFGGKVRASDDAAVGVHSEGINNDSSWIHPRSVTSSQSASVPVNGNEAGLAGGGASVADAVSPRGGGKSRGFFGVVPRGRTESHRAANRTSSAATDGQDGPMLSESSEAGRGVSDGSPSPSLPTALQQPKISAVGKKLSSSITSGFKSMVNVNKGGRKDPIVR
ncbi:putative myosin light chain kinase [Porphyridium purpureum]|uniref:Putative myosin light chain kinase n=1 Tax=Porphyridium purpureum TaxID=35688 RepID=A0A5J4Z5H1_PORPP|nr:putative myosin light chain kinase [Porphyridium purpureum]|eukprot:POR2014..scf295_1